MATESRRHHIKTFGCQMNVYDSERISDVLSGLQSEPTALPADAELIILNTCHIREKAAEKVYSELGRLRQIKAERAARGETTMIAVAGCVAQAEGQEIIARAPVVDLVVGPQSYHRLPELMAKVRDEQRSVVDTEFPDEDKFAHLPERPVIARRASAFVTVQEGCDKFCTFCVVPYTRGVEYSRPVGDLVAETERLVDQGVREITLLGQNVNAYHGEGPDGSSWTLAKLLHRLAEMDGLMRLRYTTSHPRDMDDDLINAHGELDRLMPYLHLPFQAGSNRILAAMNRKHDTDDYRHIVDRLRAVRPDIALSTDIIVGFPGEADREFQETMALVREVGFAEAYSFKYSPRPGTPASTMTDQVPDDVKDVRLQELQALLREQKTDFNMSCVGTTMPVLFEKPGRLADQMVGRSPYLQPVHAYVSDAAVGEVLEVEIKGAGPNSLEGKINSGSDLNSRAAAE